MMKTEIKHKLVFIQCYKIIMSPQTQMTVDIMSINILSFQIYIFISIQYMLCTSKVMYYNPVCILGRIRNLENSYLSEYTSAQLQYCVRTGKF
jgi:hypothetical protein